MSEKTVKYDESSDDESFEDASQQRPNPVDTLSNSQVIDEIIGKQSNLSLGEDDENDTTHSDTFVDCESSVDEDQQRDYENTLSAEQLLENKNNAETHKQEGNEKFRLCNYAEAVESYTTGLKLCPLSCPKERSMLLGNRAAAYIQLDAKKSAIEDCTRALVLDENYLKVLIRRAKLYEETDKLDESLEDFKKIVELDPSSSAGRQAISRLQSKVEERNEKLKTEMLGKLKDLGNMILKPFGLSTNNFQMQQDPNTGSYSVNFNQK